MKHLLTSIKGLAALAFLALAVGCANEFQEKRNLAVAAGFKVITPTTPEHVALLPKLPPDKITQINHQGRIYFVLPDLQNNQAYVGGPKQYQTYQQLRLARQISNDNLMAAQMNQSAAMNWGRWGGWGRGWGRGWY